MPRIVRCGLPFHCRTFAASDFGLTAHRPALGQVSAVFDLSGSVADRRRRLGRRRQLAQQPAELSHRSGDQFRERKRIAGELLPPW